MTRTRLSGSWSVSAMPERVSNGTCVEDQTVSLSPSHWATIARGSIGTACDASATWRVRTISSASRMAASASPRAIEEKEATLRSRSTSASAP